MSAISATDAGLPSEHRGADGDHDARRPAVHDARRRRALQTVVLIVVLASCPLWVEEYWLYLLAQSIVFTVAVESIMVLRRATGSLSLCQAAFMGFGAYMAAWLSTKHGWSYPAAAAVGCLTVVPVGVILAWPALRLRGLELSVLTLAVGLAASAVVFDPQAPLNFSSLGAPLKGKPDFFGWHLTTTNRLYQFLLVVAIITLAASAWLTRSNIGMTWKAMRAGRAVAAASGIPLLRTQAIGFGVSAGMAGLAGVMLLTLQGTATSDAFSTSQSIFLVVVVAAFTTGRHAYAPLGGLVAGLGQQLFVNFGISGNWVGALFGTLVVVQILVLARGEGTVGAGGSG